MQPFDFSEVSFEEYLSIRYCSLAQPGLEGISLNDLSQMHDFETSKLLSAHNKYFTKTGMGALSEQIKKEYNISGEFNIFIRNNINDSLELFFDNSLKEIQIPKNLNIKEEIYKYLSEANCTNSYIIDKFDLDYSRLNPELTIFSSPDALFGIKGLGICWFICNKNTSVHIIEKIEKFGYSCSYLSEILSITALRNKHYINKINSETTSTNFAQLQNLEKHLKEILSLEYHKLYNFAVAKLINNNEFNAEKFINEIRKKEGILLRKSLDNGFIINFGQKNFQKELYVLQRFTESY
jgi:hypothetical protein